MKIRGTTTDRLADVIQSLQFIRKSGLLTVEREVPGDFSELGTITFRDGKIIDANVGQSKGAEAFHKLVSWTTCRFLFEPASYSSSTAPHPTVELNNQVAKPGYQGRSANSSASTSIIPSRSLSLAGTIPDFDRLGLSRSHRQIFLLIDGKRSSQELARITGRLPQEVITILADLERVGLINQRLM
jgi:hypothetical protein